MQNASTGRKVVTWGAALALMTTGSFLAAALAADEPVGLQGLLGEESPASLTEDAFAPLGENWAAFTEQTQQLLFQLYAPEQPLDVAAQREVLKKLQSKLRIIKRAIGEASYATIRDPLITLYGRLSRRVDLDLAILDTLDLDAASSQSGRAKAARDSVVSSLASLDSYLKSITGGGAWLAYVRAEDLKAQLADPSRADEARETAKAVAAKLRGRGELPDAAQREFLSRPAFVALEGALGQLSVVPAAPGENYLPDLREKLATLVEVIERFEAANLVGDASDLRNALTEVRRTAADGGARIEEVVRIYYLNYNLQVLVSENLMAKMVSDERCDFSPVRDYGLGAQISGWQTTRTHAGFDLKPSSDGARFEISIDGQTHSNTVGVTPQASVQSIGDTTWRATKAGTFDGEYFHTDSTMVSVNPRTTPVSASTGFDGVPFLGGLAKSIVLDQARKRDPEARSFAAGRTIQKVAPEVDTRVDQNFRDATKDLQTDLFVRLKDAGLYTKTNKINSTEEMMRLSSRVGTDSEPAGAPAEAAFPPGKGITLNIHESLLNNGANRLNFNGRTMTEKEVRKELGDYFSKLSKKKVDLLKDYNENSEGPNTYVFDETDPLRFVVKEGAVNVVIRAAFREEGKEDIPPQVVTVPLVPRLEGENIIIEKIDPGQIRVAPRDAGQGLAAQIARSAVIRKKLSEAFDFKPESRKVELTRKDKPSVTLWVMKIKALNGWLGVWAE